MTVIPVNASKNYNVNIGGGLLSKSGEYIREICGGETAAIVTDDTVNALYGDTVEESLKKAGYSVSRFVFPHGEQSKNIDTYTALLNALSSANLTRTDAVVALGGGVVGDLAGFAAATYLRGLKFVQIPTTLLAMVDSSVGGKTAVNLQSGKNQVGVFYQPDIVICDYDTLKTLPEEFFRDGCAEIIKHAAIKDCDLFQKLKHPIMPQIEMVIARNIEIKRNVVALDERDTGIRQILNFGHTVAHGIEKISDYTVSHGSAVAMGMVAESTGTVRREIAEMLQRYNLPYEPDYYLSDERLKILEQAALSDKKRDGGRITFVIVEKIGECRLESFPIDGWIKRLKD